MVIYKYALSMRFQYIKSWNKAVEATSTTHSFHNKVKCKVLLQIPDRTVKWLVGEKIKILSLGKIQKCQMETPISNKVAD